MTTTRIFKIRAMNGTFSAGGSSPHFSMTGKVWKRRGDVSSHFTQLNTSGRQYYERMGAVVVELVTTEVSATPASDWIDAAAGREAERMAAMMVGVNERRRQYALEEYERLKKELGK